ncbi:dephospho-CoA kinase [Curvivirga sp.]|uniref:dephospho-CoA kinase n=1 Tax=Curvivirga sp. TaxID=2856848 RepID=UPI003B5903DD
MIVLGLTGNIGMGKTTVAGMFHYLGFPVQDADKVVHELMAKNGEALLDVEKAFPGIVDEDGVDRKKLGDIVFKNPEKLRELEEILYPWVGKKREKFLEMAMRKNAEIAILDVPLLFEKGLDELCNYTVCVRAPDIIQKQRVLARPNMTEEKFKEIKAQQMPIRQKMAKSDFVIQTGLNKGYTMNEVKQVVEQLLDPEFHKQYQMRNKERR